MNGRAQLGCMGEHAVCTYLQKQGFVIVAMNYACRHGEIDIIAESGQTRLFVEVKTRTNQFFSTSQVVTRTKQGKIIATAYYYNATHPPRREMVYRFDVALLVPGGEGCAAGHALTYIENAFSPGMEWL